MDPKQPRGYLQALLDLRSRAQPCSLESGSGPLERKTSCVFLHTGCEVSEHVTP